MGPVAEERTTSAIYTQCANCHCPRVEEFCPRCGQEQGPPVPTVRQVLEEIGESLFGYDSRLLRTLRGLRIPGFLTLEYLRGRRADYITPFRFYLLVSAFYLFLNLVISGLQDSVNRAAPVVTPPPPVKGVERPAAPAPVRTGGNPEPAPPPAQEEKASPDAESKDTGSASDGSEKDGNSESEERPTPKESSQTGRKDGGDTTDSEPSPAPQPANPPRREDTEGLAKWANKHETLATLLVLPLFAFLLYRTYRNSHPLFLTHLVFSLHLQCVSYLLAIALVKFPALLNDIAHALHFVWLGYIVSAAASIGGGARFLFLLVYLHRAIRAVYGEGRGKARRTTLLLFIALLFLTFMQETLFSLADSLVPGATLARFLPD